MIRKLCCATLAALVGAALALTSPALGDTSATELMALPAEKLVEIVQNEQAPRFDRVKACQRLAVIGTKDAVPVLVKLLGDESLNHYARFGLEGIPDPSVDAALREAATKLQGRPLVGVIGSIGQRQDAAAVELLTGLLANADATVADAAANALGRIGTAEAAQALKAALAKNASRTAVGDACLTCAAELAAAGHKAEALALYQAVATSQAAEYIKAGAIDAQIRLLGADAKDLLLTQIRSADLELFNIGLATARTVPNMTATLEAELDKLPVERQALLLRALGDRPDPLPLERVLAATKSESPEVREAAVYALVKLGDASAANILLDAAVGEGEVAAIASEGLKKLSGAKIDEGIVEKLNKADARQKVVLFDLVGARQILAALPTVRQALNDSNEQVRLAAIAALGQLIDMKEFDLLFSRALDDGTSAEAEAARAALSIAAQRVGDREACAELLTSRMENVSTDGQCYLLDVLGKVSGTKALKAVVARSSSNDPQLKDRATKILGDWNNPDAAPALLDIATNDRDGKYSTRALRGYIRIARQLQLPDEARVEMFHTVMKISKRADEQQIALDILTRAPSPETLTLATQHLGEPDLKSYAAEAAVKIAGKLIDRQPETVGDAMQKVVDSGVEGDTAVKAKQLLVRVKPSA